MYAFLRRHLPPWLAVVVLVSWYALLMTAIWLCWSAPVGEFRYGRL